MDTAKPTGILALQVNAGMNELKDTAEYSPQENPELGYKAAVSKPLQEGLEQGNTAAPTDINALHESPELVHKAAVPKPLHKSLEQEAYPPKLIYDIHIQLD